MVKNRVGQRNAYKLGGASGMSSAPVYGISVGMTVMGAALTVVPQRPVWIMGLVIAGTGEVLRGLSAIAPLARISRHERRHPTAWAVAPIWIPQGMKGLAVGARF
jgi:hypothetical protein